MIDTNGVRRRWPPYGSQTPVDSNEKEKKEIPRQRTLELNRGRP